MTLPVFAEVDHPAVAPVGLAYRPAQSIVGPGNGDEVDMVWHQAVRPDLNALFPAPLSHQPDVLLIVFITEESGHSPVPTLGNMVGNACGYDTSYAGHVRNLI